MAHSGEANMRLREELTRLLQSNPSSEKLERAWRVLQAVNESNIPFISYGGLYQATASLVFGNLLDHILDSCSFRDIIAVSQLSRSLRVQTRQYLNRKLVVLLKRYVTDVGAFFQTMKKTGGIVSGSTALAFIDRGGWTSQDLDLYVPQGLPRDEFLVHLAKEGYELEAVVDVKPPTDGEWWKYDQLSESVTRITKLRRKSREDPSIAKSIDLIEAKSQTSAILPILYFHATHVMNWISHDSIVLLYPTFTLKKVGVEHHYWGQRNWRDKYIRRGFTLKDTTEQLKLKCGSACPLLHRSTDDAGTLTFALIDGPITTPEPIKWQTRGVTPHQEKGVCKNPRCPRNPSCELRRLV
ncbi:hypothetical protein FRC02_006391 [Tulasnella sp. 418]|nr:hypothetical protein FRC02_006391 [Tulasnella sp. 418]